jgi:repressor LexA
MLQRIMDAKGIKSLREVLKLTQEEMAKKLHTTRTTIARWEVGMAKPRGLYIRALEELAEKTKAKAKTRRAK